MSAGGDGAAQDGRSQRYAAAGESADAITDERSGTGGLDDLVAPISGGFSTLMRMRRRTNVLSSKKAMPPEQLRNRPGV